MKTKMNWVKRPNLGVAIQTGTFLLLCYCWMVISGRIVLRLWLRSFKVHDRDATTTTTISGDLNWLPLRLFNVGLN
jgi:hypothetical protein